MISFVENLSGSEKAWLIVAGGIALLSLLFYTFLLLQASRKGKRPCANQASSPAISVILRTGFIRENLAEEVEGFLKQNYPDFSVIVVDDSGEDDGTPMLDALRARYSNLHITATPSNSKFTSLGKLSLTVGIKAAQSDWVIQANRRNPPCSENWLATIARRFDDDTALVIGYNRLQGSGSIPSFFTIGQQHWRAIMRHALARSGGPFLGDPKNLAYRKEAFMKQRGFAGYNYFAGGEGDLLAMRLAEIGRVQIEIDRDAHTHGLAPKSWRDYYRLRITDLAAKKHLPLATRIWFMVDPTLRYAIWLTAIVGMLLSPKLLWLALSVVAWRRLLRLFCEIGAMHRLKEKWNPLGLWFYDLLAPWVGIAAAKKYRTYKQQPAWR